VRALSRVACPATEEALLMIALHGTAHHLRLRGGREPHPPRPPTGRGGRDADQGARCRPRAGCTHQRYLDAHHIEHWADGGETDLSNLVTLCRLHHRLVHEGEIRIETPPGGGWRFLHPDGRHFEVIRCTPTPTYDGDELQHTHADLGITIDRTTAATRWQGESMDYELGV
jgi:hypothetical protein